MSNPFPLITCLADLLPHIANKPEILVKPGRAGSTVVCYQFQDSDTFDNAFAAECRGLVFDSKGDIAARPLHKFFNLGEKPGTEPEAASAVRVMDKRDGSMVHTVWLDGRLMMKSKKSFNNVQVDMANDWLARPENAGVLHLCNTHAEMGATVIFELTSPANRIVVGYEATEMRLLHIRNNITGDYWPAHLLELRAEQSGASLVYEPSLSVAEALASLPAMEGAEGFVLQFANGDMVKAKCPWYLNLHRTVSFTRERDIAEAALEERLDDIKSALSTIGVDLAAVNAVEHRVKQGLLVAQDVVATTVKWAGIEGRDRKAFAIANNGSAYFGLLMAAFQGKEPDYKDWFRKNRLKQCYSLEPVGATVEED